MSSLPAWAAWAIVAACPLLGPVIAFLMFLAVVVLDRIPSDLTGLLGFAAAGCQSAGAFLVD